MSPGKQHHLSVTRNMLTMLVGEAVDFLVYSPVNRVLGYHGVLLHATEAR